MIQYTSTNSTKTSLFLFASTLFILTFDFQASAQAVFAPNPNFKTKDILVGVHLGLGGNCNWSGHPKIGMKITYQKGNWSGHPKIGMKITYQKV
jgi:hypothetical protein